MATTGDRPPRCRRCAFSDTRHVHRGSSSGLRKRQSSCPPSGPLPTAWRLGADPSCNPRRRPAAKPAGRAIRGVGKCAIPRGCGNTSTVSLAALLGVLFLLLVTAYFPFHWDPPRVVSNEVARSASGSLRFGEMNRARTSGTPAWLADARNSGIVQIELGVRQSHPSSTPRHRMMLASDFSHTDFALGQTHPDLLLGMRRPGSDSNGGSTFAVGGALQSRRWNHVVVTRRRRDPDRRQRFTSVDRKAPGGRPSAGARGGCARRRSSWRRSMAGRNPAGRGAHARPRGRLRPPRCAFHPCALSVLPGPRRTLPAPQPEWWATLVLTSCRSSRSATSSSGPAGRQFARSPPPCSRSLLALVLAAGKFLFHGRHTEAGDIVGRRRERCSALVGVAMGSPSGAGTGRFPHAIEIVHDQ